MNAQVEGPLFDAVFSITGAFDPFAASHVRARLAELPREACVMLDFSLASEVSDLALAVLASAFEGPRHPRVVLRGLTHHQERMLRYLGLDEMGLDVDAGDRPPS
jgi:hypothetical protein